MLITFPSMFHARVDSRARFKNETARARKLSFRTICPSYILSFLPLSLSLFSACAHFWFPFSLLAFFNHATSLKKSTGTIAKRGQLIGLIAIVLHERLKTNSNSCCAFSTARLSSAI